MKRVMKKALILTYYWPPAGGSGVQRWLKFVKYFRDFNIEPVVYTVDSQDYPIVDESLQKDVPEGIEVLKQPIFEPNTILSFFKKSKSESAGFLNPNPSVVGKLLQYIRANYFIPDARMFWIKPSVKYLKKYLQQHKIDVLITTGPPHSLDLIGLQWKEELGIKWIADFRDPWTEIDYFHQLPLTQKAIEKHHQLEQNVLKNADAVLVIGDTMKQNYEPFCKDIYTVTNGYDAAVANEKVMLDQKFSITHIGLMNSDRNPVMLWEVLAALTSENKEFAADFELHLIGKTAPSIEADIINFGLKNNCNFVSYLNHNEVISFQKKSQVLLLLVNNVPSAKGIITGKIFEYLMAKRPILAIAPTDGDLAVILKKTNAGTVVGFNEKEQLKNSILALYEQFKKGDLQVDSINIEQYHRRELTRQVAEIIEKIV